MSTVKVYNHNIFYENNTKIIVKEISQQDNKISFLY